jgi:putative sterol carrier protein
MTATVNEFFEGIARRRHEPLLEKASGTIRFELGDGERTERWLLEIDGGDVAVSHKNATADCTLRTSAAVFRALVRGEANAMAAVLRGAVTVDGDLELLLRFQRLLPSSSSAHPSQPVGKGGRS